MVNLTRIYTRTGDAGRTRLSDLSEVGKTDPRVEAYGAVDEANSVLGIVTASGEVTGRLLAALRLVQNELFDVGADLSTPVVPDPTWPPLRIEQPSVDRLEGWCDEFGDGLDPLASFILPGGTLAAAYLHLARTVVRRAERAAWRAVEQVGLAGAPGITGGVNPLALTYLNRLSDLLFIAARAVNPGGDVLWVPGTDREPLDPRGVRQRRRISAATQEETPSAD